MATTLDQLVRSRTTTLSMTAVFRRAIERMITAREREARARVADYLATLDRDALARVGYTEAEIDTIARGAKGGHKRGGTLL